MGAASAKHAPPFGARTCWPEQTQEGPFSAVLCAGPPPEQHEVGKRRAKALTVLFQLLYSELVI